MASVTSSNPNSVSSYSPKSLCQIVGYACLAGFAIDMLVLTLPPSLGNPQWRAGIIQQVADRSIILLFGTALLIFGLSGRALLKQFSRLCMLLGAVFLLLCPLVIADTAKLQAQAISDITAQASQAQAQIEKVKADPSALGTLIERAKADPNADKSVTIEKLQAELEARAQSIPTQTNTATQRTRTESIKVGVRIVGNLIVVGIGLISLGRYGMRSRLR
jgi:hypothetical protein